MAGRYYFQHVRNSSVVSDHKQFLPLVYENCKQLPRYCKDQEGRKTGHHYGTRTRCQPRQVCQPEPTYLIIQAKDRSTPARLPI